MDARAIRRSLVFAAATIAATALVIGALLAAVVI